MATAAPATNPSTQSPSEVVLISHSPIFYWWPVWLVGFLLAAASYFGGHVMAIVPAGTIAESQRVVDGQDGPRDLLIAPAGRRFLTDQASEEILQPRHRTAPGNAAGMIFLVTLCLVILITNVHMRGLWAVVVVLSVVVVTGLFAALGWWDPVLRTLGVIDIHINALGYFTLSLFVFLIWILTFLVYDRRHRLVFSRGQLRVREAVGLGERVYDTFGMAVQKHRDDPFRHWLLGLGSGDLTIRVAGTNANQIEAPNILQVNKKLEQINRMLQERQVVPGS